jgi:hypothetical protein
MGKTREIKESVKLADRRLVAAAGLIDKKLNELKTKYDTLPNIDDKISVLNELEDFCDSEILYWIENVLAEEDNGPGADKNRIEIGYKQIQSFERTVQNINKLRKGLFAIQAIKNKNYENN